MSGSYGTVEEAGSDPHSYGRSYDNDSRSADSHPLLSELDEAERRGGAARRRYAVPKAAALVLGSLACLAYASKARSELNQVPSGSVALASKEDTGAGEGRGSDGGGRGSRRSGSGGGSGHQQGLGYGDDYLEDDATGLTGGEAFLEMYPIYFVAGHTGSPLAGRSYIYETYGDDVKLVSDQHGDSVDLVVHSESCKTFFTTGTGVYSFDELKGDNSTKLYSGSQPAGIDLCETTGDLYWADEAEDAVYRGCSLGDVKERCNATKLVSDLPGVRDVSYLQDEDGNCRKLFMAVPHVGVFHSDCNGTSLEALVPDSNPRSVIAHRRSFRVYWVDKGLVMSADMVTGGNISVEYSSADADFEWITIIDDHILVSSTNTSLIEFFHINEDSTVGTLVHHDLVRGLGYAYGCSVTAAPSAAPNAAPTTNPTPTKHPTLLPTLSPTHKPTHEHPTVSPTPFNPTDHPKLALPTAYPSPLPTKDQYVMPSVSPTNAPHAQSPYPTLTSLPTSKPTKSKPPTFYPTQKPTDRHPTWPTHPPTVHKAPTAKPTGPSPQPTDHPFPAPTHVPTHPAPTPGEPTPKPTHHPAPAPTHDPTHPAPTPREPTKKPTHQPVPNPTWHPKLDIPTAHPTHDPTHPAPTRPHEPTHRPTHPAPTEHKSPTPKPTAYTFGDVPTPRPTKKPSHHPTPTPYPVSNPTVHPRLALPTVTPSVRPTAQPTGTGGPTRSPSTPGPTKAPTTSGPTRSPSKYPGGPSPTFAPSTPHYQPTLAPTLEPTVTGGPTKAPTTSGPTKAPTTPGPTRAPTASVMGKSPSNTKAKKKGKEGRKEKREKKEAVEKAQSANSNPPATEPSVLERLESPQKNENDDSLF